MPAVVLVEGRDAHEAVHAVLRTQQTIGTGAPHDEGRALQARLLAARLIDDLGLESTAFRPLQVHAEQHLDPVLGFDSTLANRDGDDRAVVGVWVREQEVELVCAELPGHRRTLLGDLLSQLWIVLRQLLELHEVAGATLETIPGRDQLAALGGLTGDRAGMTRVIPDARFAELGV